MNTPNSAVIFDLDGTLVRSNLDFDAIRAEIGLPPGPILESLVQLDPPARRRAEVILARHEHEAALHAEWQEGAAEVVSALRAAGRPVAILTRNSRATVELILQSHALPFDAVRTREDGAIKPAAEPVLSLCRCLHADPARSWVVGDYLFDILSGRAAGTRTVLMVGDAPLPDYAQQADHTIRRLPELLDLLAIR